MVSDFDMVMRYNRFTMSKSNLLETYKTSSGGRQILQYNNIVYQEVIMDATVPDTPVRNTEEVQKEEVHGQD
jgi:hypothetical protein